MQEAIANNNDLEGAAAKARLEQARIDLERTTLRAPFDGRVRSENSEVSIPVIFGVLTTCAAFLSIFGMVALAGVAVWR